MGEDADPRRNDVGQFLAGHDGNNTRHPLCRCRVDPENPCMRMRRAQKHDMRHPGQIHVADIGSTALQQAIRLNPNLPDAYVYLGFAQLGLQRNEQALAAFKQALSFNPNNVLAQAGKTPVVVDIDAFGLQNCFEVNYEPDAGQTVALLNIGASVMNINIVRGGIPLFTRDVSVGGNQYTDALQKELDLSFEDAERLKKGETLPSVTDEQKQQILRSVSDILTLEIQKTFDFFRATAAGQHIEKIYLAGGSSAVPGLTEALRQEFSMPVETLNPFQKIQPGPESAMLEQNAGQLAVAVGLALRSFETL